MYRPLFVLLASLLIIFSCALRGVDSVVDRKSIPALAAGVPVTSSEIRDISFKKVAGEGSHNDLHLNGRIFTKSGTTGNERILPCSGCIVKLKGVKDTSLTIRMTSESDGYFTYHGEKSDFAVYLENEGHNQVVIDHIDASSGGVTSLILINAAGNQPERFTVTKNQNTYSWTKTQ